MTVTHLPGRATARTGQVAAAARARACAWTLLAAGAWATAPVQAQDLGATAAAEDAGQPRTGWRVGLALDHHLDALPLADAGTDDVLQRLRLDRGARLIGRVDDEARLMRLAGDGWRWGWLARQRARLSVSRGTVEAARSAEDDATASRDGHWPVRVRFQAWSGQGLAGGRAWAPAPGWTAHIEAQALRLGRWRERRIDGDIDHAGATDTYTGRLTQTLWDSAEGAPFGPTPAAHGHALLLRGHVGHTLALGTATDGPALRPPALRLGLAWQDAGWLHWRRRAVDDGVLDTDTARRDADGYLVYDPLIQGHWSTQGRARWQRPDLALTLQAADRQSRDDGPGWTARHDRDTGWRHTLHWQLRGAARLSWTPAERQLAVALAAGAHQLTLGADRIDRGARSLRLAWQWTAADAADASVTR